MFSIPWRAALVAAALTHPTWAPAQRADPSDPRASVPALSYTSAFAAYRALAEQSVGSWREANEKVERAGGWLGAGDGDRGGQLTDLAIGRRLQTADLAF